MTFDRKPLTLAKLILVLTLPLYILDQATKFWTVLNMEPSESIHDGFRLVEGWFHWVRIHNQGVAFGMGNGTSWAPVVFLLVPIIALVLIRLFWVKGFFDSLMSRISVALLLCGIFGNLTDRLIQGFLLEAYRAESLWTRLSEGYVVDFVAVRLPLYDKIVPRSGGWWPAFNVADSCICVAAALLFISGLREEQRNKKGDAGKSADGSKS